MYLSTPCRNLYSTVLLLRITALLSQGTTPTHTNTIRHTHAHKRTPTRTQICKHRSPISQHEYSQTGMGARTVLCTDTSAHISTTEHISINKSFFFPCTVSPHPTHKGLPHNVLLKASRCVLLVAWCNDNNILHGSL